MDRIYRDTADVLAKREVKERYAKEGGEPVGSTPAQAAAYLKAEIARWGKVVVAAKIQPE